jgi:hypothetical protein
VQVNKYSPLPGEETPKIQSKQEIVEKPAERKPYKPTADHPWRKLLIAQIVVRIK